MQHLFTQWTKISQKIKNAHVCVFLDYDGTLTKITNTPQQACLSNETKDVLQKLIKNPQCQIILVSGRSLKNIKKLVGIKNVVYAGNHGLEFGDLRTTFAMPISARYKTILKKIKAKLAFRLASIKGVLLEDKKFSLSLHYRLAKKKDLSVIKAIFYNVIENTKTCGELTVLTGKQVLEITPAIAWNKGKIVLLILVLLKALLKTSKIIPLYIGDDVTDENAFSAIKNQGITVFVGDPKKTQANYYLKNIQEVKMLLKKINLLLASSKV